MNDARRKALKTLLAQIDVAGLEAIRDDEEQSFENLPESMQQGEKGEKMQEIVEALNSIIDGLEEGIANLEEIAGLTK